MSVMNRLTGFRRLLRWGGLIGLLLLLVASPGWAAPTVTAFNPADGSVTAATGVTASFSEPMDPATITNGSFTVSRFIGYKAIASGGSYSLALRNDGTVIDWGTNGLGVAAPEGLAGVTAIAAGLDHAVALKSDGTVVNWGGYVWGEVPIPALDPPAGLSGVVAIAAGGYNNTIALKNDGTVVAWGDEMFGYSKPPTGLSGVTAVAGGSLHSVALKSDGTVVSWGNNNYGQCTPPAGLTGVVAIAAGSHHTVALKSDGTVVAWGMNNTGQTSVPAGLNGVVAISAIGSHTVALKMDGTVVAWGSNFAGQCTVPSGLTGVTAASAGGSHTVALKLDGSLVAWGANSNGQARVPVEISGVSAVSVGNLHALVLKKDGTVLGLGANNALQSTVPAGLSGVVAVAARGERSVALKSDGTVVAWGQNDYGQSTVPAGLSGITAVAAGLSHTAAVRNDGTVVAWGRNNKGQCNVPAGLSGVVAVAAGNEFTVALKSDGTVVAWGNNWTGQSTPPAGLSGVVAITAGFDHAVALKSDGSVVVWGSNYSKQGMIPAGLSGVTAIAADGSHTLAVTDGTVVDWGYGHGSPVPAGLDDVVAVAEGQHSVALKRDGTLVAWGFYQEDAYSKSFSYVTTPQVERVQGSVSYDMGTESALFTPSAPFEPGYTYLATVNTGAKNTTGAQLAADSRMSFLVNERSQAGITLNSLVQSYNGKAKVVTATTAPAGLPVEITYNGAAAPPSAPGSYDILAKVLVPNFQHYQGSAVGTLHITNAAVTLGNLSHTYNGTPRAATATSSPSSLAISITYNGSPTPPTAAGNYAVVATADGSGYHGAAFGTLTIAKAPATAALSGLSHVYDRTPKAATATTIPAGVAVAVSYNGSSTSPTAAGSYNVIATIVDPNYYGPSATGTLDIQRAPVTVSLSGLDHVYDGTAKQASATTAPTGVAVLTTYSGLADAPIGAGSYQVVARSIDPNYVDASVTGTMIIAKAQATVTPAGLKHIFDGSPKGATAATTPAGLAVDFSYDGSATVPSGIGRYIVVGTVNDPNYEGTASGTMSIWADLRLTNLNQVYDGTPRVVGVSTNPVEVPVVVTYNGIDLAPPTDAGEYAIVAKVSDPRYDGEVSGTLVVTKASQSITLTATSSSGLPVSFVVTNGPGRIEGSTLHFTGPGNVTIRATQGGNNNYLEAPEVNGSFVITNP